MSDFPPASMVMKEDSAYLNIEYEDNTVRSDVEGGYEFTRPRTTRAPRRIFTTGFTALTESDLTLLKNFYLSKRGGADSFTWTLWTTGEVVTVRFLTPIKSDYAGVGQTPLWNVTDVKLKEV